MKVDRETATDPGAIGHLDAMAQELDQKIRRNVKLAYDIQEKLKPVTL